MQLSVSSLKVKKPSKRVLLFVLAGVLILALLVVALASYQKHRNQVAADSLKAHNASVLAMKQHNDEDQAVKDKLAATEAKLSKVCTYVTVLSQAKATKALVTVPADNCKL